MELKGGLKKLEIDNRDLVLGAFAEEFNLPDLSEIPESYSLTTLSIKDQVRDGNTDFCGSCAGTVAKEVQENVELYYPYLFAAAKFESGDDPDSWGLSLRDVGQAIRKWGIPRQGEIPPEILELSFEQRRRFDNYPDWLKVLAKNQAAKNFFFIKGKYDAFDDFKVALWAFRDARRLGVFGVLYGWPLYQYELTGTPEGFGHALTAIGYEKDWIIVQNSAGENVGMGGKHKIGRETFNHYADQFGVMMFVDLPDNLNREEASRMSEEFRKGKKFFEPRHYQTLWETIIGLVKRWFGLS